MLFRTFIYTFIVTFCQGNMNTVREMSGKCQGILMTPVAMNPIHTIKFVVIPPRFVLQQYLWNVAIQLTFVCYNSWANLRCLRCSPLGKKLLWNRTIRTDSTSQEIWPWLCFVLFCCGQVWTGSTQTNLACFNGTEDNLFAMGKCGTHYYDVIMGEIASQITSLTVVYSAVYSGSDQSKHQSSASLASVWGIHRGPVNSPHKWQVTQKMFPFDDVIMINPLRTIFE